MKEKKNNTFAYILIIIIFLAGGITLGVYGTKKFLNDKNNDKDGEAAGVVDITENKEYSATINKLYASLGENPLYYSSKGISIETMDNATKLGMMYDFIITNSLYSEEELDSIDSNKCDHDFLINTDYSKCKVYKIAINNFSDSFKKLFNSTSIDTSVSFKYNNYSCVISDSNYICGKVSDNTVTGSLTAKFNIQKVTLENDIISIYDKGYLIDTRSNKVNTGDGYQNHYLHTSDSNAYYYELKNADNVTFKHEFKKASDNNYYYVSSSVVPKE